MKTYWSTLSLLIIGLVTLNSCAKAHTCECRLNSSPDVVVVKNVIVGTKKVAKKSCDNKSSVAGDYACALKN